MDNYAFILLTRGIWGGAEKRFTQLVQYLSIKYPDRYFFIVTWALYYKILEIYPNYPTGNLIPIGSQDIIKNDTKISSTQQINEINHPGIIKQVYRFFKHLLFQRKYYQEIEEIRNRKNISCFLGIYNGIIPLYFYMMRKKREIKIIFSEMDSWFREVLPNRKKFWYRKYNSFNFALENSDYIDFLSPFILEGVRKRGIKVNKSSLSITPCSFTNYEKCRLGNKSKFQVAFAGRLEKDKNPNMFVEAAIQLTKKNPNIIFHIMGEGRLSSEIKDQVIKSGFANIIFHGFHSDPCEILADTSVFVSIQSTNNYPSQSVLEAMGCGNAIIATNVGDTGMFVNEQNGILINLNLIELVNAIETLYLDIDLRNRLSKGAYSYVRNYHTIDRMADYYINLFNNA